MFGLIGLMFKMPLGVVAVVGGLGAAWYFGYIGGDDEAAVEPAPVEQPIDATG